MTVVCAPLIGPVLGGYITDNFSWRWIFLINVPVAVLAATTIRQVLRTRETERRRLPIDYVGFFLVVVGVGALQIMLDKGKELDWFGSNVIIALALVSVVALTCLVIWELGERAPVVNLRLFLIRNFTVSVTVMALAYSSMFAGIVLVPLLLQTQLGYTATWAGLVVAPVGFLSLMMTPIIGPALPRLNLRLVITMAMVIFSASSFWRARFTTGADYLHLALPQALQGGAIALYFAPLVMQYTAELPPALYANAASLMNFTRMVSGAFATSLVTTFWDRRAATYQTALVEHVTPGAPAYDSASAALRVAGLDPGTATGVMLQGVSQQVYLLSANEIFYCIGWIFLGLIPIVWLAHGIRPVRPSH
jgi:DHA2 family multidrug resistance protein